MLKVSMKRLRFLARKLLPIAVLVFFLSLFLIPKAPVYSAASFMTKEISVTQLHAEGDAVHRYELQVLVNNPLGENIQGYWRVDCGTLERNTGLKVVMRYTGDCLKATVSVIVINSERFGQQLTQPLFISGEKKLIRIKPKNTEATGSATTTAPYTSSTLAPTIRLAQPTKPYITNSNALAAAILLITIAAVLIVFHRRGLLAIPIHAEDKKEACKVGDKRDCKFVGMKYSIHGRKPHEDEEFDLFLLWYADFVSMAKWLVRKMGPTPALSMMPEFLRNMTHLHKRINNIAKLRDGIDMWGVIQWDECEKQHSWLLWTHNAWVIKTKDIKITPPLYRYPLNRNAWNPQYMLNQKFVLKNLSTILQYMSKKALHECPTKQQEF